MQSWKVRLGLMLTMLAMLLAVSVPASAQTPWVQFPPGECWVDADGNTWCPWDASLFGEAQVVEDVEDVDADFETLEDQLDALVDFEEDLAELEEDCDENGDDDCDFDNVFSLDESDCDDDGDDDDCDFDEERFEELFDDCDDGDDCDFDEDRLERILF